MGLDRADAVEVRQRHDVEQLGAGSGVERVQAGSESAVQLVGSHGQEATPAHDAQPRSTIMNEMAALVPLLVLAAVCIGAIGPIWWWSRRIEKRIGPPKDRPGHEPERLHFKYGVEPQGGDQTWGNLG